MINTGVNVTASCLSENMVPRMSAYPPEALYIKNRINKKTGNLYQKSGLNPIR
jgi:hypothetical protein